SSRFFMSGRACLGAGDMVDGCIRLAACPTSSRPGQVAAREKTDDRCVEIQSRQSVPSSEVGDVAPHELASLFEVRFLDCLDNGKVGVDHALDRLWHTGDHQGVRLEQQGSEYLAGKSNRIVSHRPGDQFVKLDIRLDNLSDII